MPKRSNLSIFAENWHAEYHEYADSYVDISFLSSNLKSIFEQIWAEEVEAFCFAWKLAYRLCRGCWFLLRQYFSEFPTLNPFCLYLSWKVKALLFWLEIETQTHTHTHAHTRTHNISRMLVLISTLVFSNLKPKSLGYWFLFWD